MQTLSQSNYNAIAASSAYTTKLRVCGEWNLNRYRKFIYVDNLDASESDYGFELDMFPIDSIFNPNRPQKKGIVKARVGSVITSSTGHYPAAVRCYVSGPDAAYKYWVSPYPSGSTQSGGGYFIPKCAPGVIYDSFVPCNKVSIGFETSVTSVTDFTVYVHNGASWELIAENPSIDADGRCNLWLQSNGTWNSTFNLSNSRQIKGLHIRVNSVNAIGRHAEIIEVSPRLQLDLSDYVIGFGYQMDVSDNDFVSPMGSTSSNSGSITFSNLDNLFSNFDDSLISGLVDRNIEFWVDQVVNGETVRVATMISDSWSGTLSAEASVDCTDYSRIMQTTLCPKMLLEGKSAAEVIWRICDIIGFNNYIVDVLDNESTIDIPYFWTDGTESVWDVFQKIGRGLQIAIFFDVYGRLRIKSKGALYGQASAPVWTITETPLSGRQPDLISVGDSFQYEANKAVVHYRPTKLLISNDDGSAATESVWTPDDTVTLRASPLTRSMSSEDNAIYIPSLEARTWPYSGLINVEGEIMEWDAKQYIYYDKTVDGNGNPTPNTHYVWINNADEEKNVLDNLSSDSYKSYNYYNGCLDIKQRGLWGTQVVDHRVDIDKWYGAYGEYNAGYTTSNAPRFFDPGTSSLRLQTDKNFGGNTYYQVYRDAGSAVGGFKWAGTRVKFGDTTSYTHGVAGIALSVSGQKQGYYFEIMLTELIDSKRGSGSATNRDFTHEVRLYRREASGALFPFASSKYTDDGTGFTGMTKADGKGTPYNVVKGAWYDLDMSIDASGHFACYVNGNCVLVGTDPRGTLPLTDKISLFTRGFTTVDFDYVYAAASQEYDQKDQSGFLDKVKGAYSSSQGDREVIYGTHKVKRTKGKKTTTYTEKYNKRMYDEFGPMAHEIREFEVNFEKFPVVYSGIQLSNDYEVVVPYYEGNPFGAKFALANASRKNAVVQGEDSSLGIDNAITQQMFIFGRTVVQQDQKELTQMNKYKKLTTAQQDQQDAEYDYDLKTTDDLNKRKRGEIIVNFESDYIQSEGAAKNLVAWINNHWATPSDILELEIFGNPLLELGDVVVLNIPSKGNLTAGKYVIYGISNGWDNGLTTSVTVRRIP